MLGQRRPSSPNSSSYSRLPERRRHAQTHEMRRSPRSSGLAQLTPRGKGFCSRLEQNPFPLGVNWASPLDLGLRLISWVWACRLLSGSREYELLFGDDGRLWPSIHRHQWMIARMHSRGSSANNHLIGEMAGLYISSAVWGV